MESWQKQQSREEQEKNPYTQGRYGASQHSFSTLQLISIIKKSLHSWTRFPPSSKVETVSCPTRGEDPYSNFRNTSGKDPGNRCGAAGK